MMSLLVVRDIMLIVGGDMSAEKIAVLFLAIPTSAFLIDFFLSRSVFGYGYRLFVAPGVIIHEISHAFACLLTGAKIRAFSILDKSGGRVEHYKPKIPIIGQMLISLAPFIGGGTAIYFLAKLVGFNLVDPVEVVPSLAGINNAVRYLVSSVDYRDWQNLILVYLLVSIAVTMNPSVQDVKNILAAIVFLALVALGIWKFTAFRPDIGYFIAQTPHQIVVILATIDLILLLGLILSIVFFAISKLIKPV